MRRFLLSVIAALLLLAPVFAQPPYKAAPPDTVANPVFVTNPELNWGALQTYLIVLIGLGAANAALLTVIWGHLAGIRAAVEKTAGMPKS